MREVADPLSKSTATTTPLAVSFVVNEINEEQSADGRTEIYIIFLTVFYCKLPTWVGASKITDSLIGQEVKAINRILELCC